MSIKKLIETRRSNIDLNYSLETAMRKAQLDNSIKRQKGTREMAKEADENQHEWGKFPMMTNKEIQME